jgi:hypothetical protein
MIIACGSGTSTDSSDGSDGGDGKASAPQEATVTASAADMVAEFEDNELAADSKYKGKWIEITGKVNKIETELLDGDKYYLQMGGGGEYEILTVNCHGIPNDELSALSTGEDVTVVGQFDDGGSLGVEMKKCRLVK